MVRKTESKHLGCGLCSLQECIVYEEVAGTWEWEVEGWSWGGGGVLEDIGNPDRNKVKLLNGSWI